MLIGLLHFQMQPDEKGKFAENVLFPYIADATCLYSDLHWQYPLTFVWDSTLSNT